jgi:hypothetical protein
MMPPALLISKKLVNVVCFLYSAGSLLYLASSQVPSTSESSCEQEDFAFDQAELEGNWSQPVVEQTVPDTYHASWYLQGQPSQSLFGAYLITLAFLLS